MWISLHRIGCHALGWRWLSRCLLLAAALRRRCTPRACGHCGVQLGVLPFAAGTRDHFCSAACEDNWIPF